MGVDVEEDLKRKMVELNLNAAARALSPQTGYLHLNYEETERSDTIPLLENFSWVLALFRSRLSENILQGKALLEKLLEFEVEGNFPVYLHEFPACKDRDFSLEILPVIHWLLVSFRTALGETLPERLEGLRGRILAHAAQLHSQRPLCPSSEFRWKSASGIPFESQWTPATPMEWASALISWQMTPSSPIPASAIEKWHPQLAVFMGVQDLEWAEPKVTLYDLFMGHYFGLYSSRALRSHPTSLLAALVHPFEDKREPLSLPVPSARVDPSSPHPLVMYWGGPGQLHSLVLESSHASCTISHFTAAPFACEILLHLPPGSIPEGQEALELAIFSTLEALPDIQIGGSKATTFQLGERIALHETLHLQIEQVEGEGRFFGHLLRANRSSQKGKNLKYDVYDWKIALRTLARSGECTLKVVFST